ncbi:hypothetical protein ACOMCU_15900 [Lysinibacillus sp. UGB7]|uniref:hypothetical protein n=1 Tax=Lysinibacillus sp. UGB7 TaxID=3411039 RepID=UPI003B81AB89
MYRKYETDGYHLMINDRFISENAGKEFLDIGTRQEILGRIERDNIVLEITYIGYGVLMHRRTNQSYNDLQLSKEQWDMVKVHFRMNPQYYEYNPSGLQLFIYEAGEEVKIGRLFFENLESSVEQLLINLFVQHVACKPAEELYEIRDRIQTVNS